ncbi:Gremlin-1 [Zootermopsis nevadensis]|uniref:Gremlin-1 n=1 Tax=Zootermopsis nevadensis TaxID=136037 RepID=A0A067R9Y8_ZOONE|nr:Gremlin-1 [Zootermopsis nevadensis]
MANPWRWVLFKKLKVQFGCTRQRQATEAGDRVTRPRLVAFCLLSVQSYEVQLRARDKDRRQRQSTGDRSRTSSVSRRAQAALGLRKQQSFSKGTPYFAAPCIVDYSLLAYNSCGTDNSNQIIVTLGTQRVPLMRIQGQVASGLHTMSSTTAPQKDLKFLCHTGLSFLRMVFHQSGLVWLHSWAVVYMWLFFTSSMAAGAENDREPAAGMGSILEIINTQEVERLLAARRDNVSREQRQFLGQNALDDGEVSDQDEIKREDSAPDKDSDDDIRQQLNISGSRKFVNRQSGASRKSHTIGIEVLLKKSNESFPHNSHHILAELGGYNGDKLLKSSKNALMNPRRRRPGRRESHEEEEDDDDESDAPAFKSCAFCKPKKAAWITVSLNCPSMSPRLRKKRILRIKQCKCITEVFN